MVVEFAMNTIIEKIRSAITGSTPQPQKKASKPVLETNFNSDVVQDPRFPRGFHVYGISVGPDGNVMVGAENPRTSEGSVFLRQPTDEWKQIPLPDETSWLSQFIRLEDGTYVASGMSLLGRGAILTGDKSAENWKSIDLDLHAYSMIHQLVRLSNGDLLASTGNMITQGKTKPVLLRSQDQGKTWEIEELKLPITYFQTLTVEGDRIYGGPAGDHSPVLYYSDDQGKTWEELPKLPSYKTYKIMTLRHVDMNGSKKLIALMWGYKIDIADRVVRLYVLNEETQEWDEMPPILDSHFIFSFFVSREQVFYAGSEKGLVLSSKDFGKSWEILERFTTNIGAQAIYQDENSNLWFGKDFVEPNHHSLWTLRKS